MKTPLSYQISEYDCGPISLLNAVSYLFPRNEISPDLTKFIHMYCLDGFNGSGEIGKSGTSCHAMNFLCNWLNQYREGRGLPIRCEALRKEEIFLGHGSRIVECLANGGCAVTHVELSGGHYVLLTGTEADTVCLFDPYFIERYEWEDGISVVADAPDRMNRKVKFAVMNSKEDIHYAFGVPDRRECILLYNCAAERLNSGEQAS